jgi:hypothetical protein
LSEIKYISNRVSYRELPHEITVVISPRISKAKFVALSIWLILFTLCGLFIASQLFVRGYDFYTKTGIFAFTAFWGWFIYKTGYAWFWRKSGREFIRIHDGTLTIKRSINTYGKTYNFLIGNIKGIDKRDLAERSFSAELEKSFWVVAGERIKFDYLGREIRFGLQLNDEESKRLVQLFIKWFKNNKQ